MYSPYPLPLFNTQLVKPLLTDTLRYGQPPYNWHRPWHELLCVVYLHATSEIRTTSDPRTTDKPFAPERLLVILNYLRERTATLKSFRQAWHWHKFSSTTMFRLRCAIYCKPRPQSSPLRGVASYCNLRDADNLSTADKLLAPNVSVIQSFKSYPNIHQNKESQSTIS